MPSPHDAWRSALPHARGVDDVGTGGGWQPLRELLEPRGLHSAIDARVARTGCEDRVAVGSVLVRDLLAPLTRLAVAAWSQDRVVLDVSTVNVLADVSADGPRVGLAEVRAAGADGHRDPLGTLEAVLLDGTVAAMIESLRRVVRVGRRHLWGNVALAAVNTLTTLSHRVGGTADADRVALLGRRPDLLAHLDVVTTDDGRGRAITYAIRRSCCLLVKIPPGTMCGTCSLRPRADRIAACDAHFRAARFGSAWRG